MDTLTRKEGYITPYAAAELLSVSVKTIYKLCGSGELEAVKIGRSVRILGTSLQDFIARNTVRRPEEPPQEPEPIIPPQPKRKLSPAGFVFLPPRS